MTAWSEMSSLPVRQLAQQVYWVRTQLASMDDASKVADALRCDFGREATRLFRLL